MFSFKRFSVNDDRCAMKVGTDGVLLGGWVSVDEVGSVLDIGTGSGLIALMLAQRTGEKTKIDAVEISESDFQQAIENVNASPWSEKIRLFHSSIQNFENGTSYDLIVSNPPYFINSSAPPSGQRRQARHTDSLSFPELLEAVVPRLKPDGKFAVILPVSEGNLLQELAKTYDLYCVRRLAFYSRQGKSQERWLLEFSKHPVPVSDESLTLHGTRNEWSAEYKMLLRDFYLWI